MIREIPPTAGMPFTIKDFLKAAIKKNCRGSLEEDFKKYLGVPYAKVTYSGTAAFYLTLEALKNLSAKKIVVIPSYICPLIPLAIHRAGLKIAVCDINRDNFNFDLNELRRICAEKQNILAIVTVHLAGIPVEIDAAKQIAKENNIFMVEDCAQSLGALYKGKRTGTLGDFSFFSLCRGKGLTIYEGGVVVANDVKDAALIEAKIKEFVKNDFLSEGIKILEVFGYWIFYRLSLFWFVFRLPQIFWRCLGQPLKAATEYFTVDFPIHKVSRFRNSIGHMAFSRIDQEIEKQRQKALYYIKGLKNIPGIKIVTETNQAKSSYPYLVIIFDDPLKRKKAQRLLENSGLGVSEVYALAISDYDYLKDIIKDQKCTHARYMAERQITLSTSTFLKKKDQDKLISVLKAL